MLSQTDCLSVCRVAIEFTHTKTNENNLIKSAHDSLHIEPLARDFFTKLRPSECKCHKNTFQVVRICNVIKIHMHGICKKKKNSLKIK